MQLQRHNGFALPCIMIMAGFFLFYNLGALPLSDPDEPRYGESAREMIELGSVMVPYFNYAPRLEKPVLYYWTICLSYVAFGVSEFSARFSSACAGLLLVCAVFFFMRRFAGAGTAALSCVILCSSPLFFVPGRLSMPDMVLALFVVLSLFCFYAGWQEPDPKRKNRLYAGFYAFQVLAAWTKGPVGILLPVAVAALSLARERDFREMRSLRLEVMLPLVLLGSAPWYLYAYLFVDRAEMLRLTESSTAGYLFGTMGTSQAPAWFYVAVVLPGLAPWIFLAPWACCLRTRELKPARLRRFFETWAAFVVVFFSACISKKPQYVITLSCAAACWLGMIADHAFGSGATDRKPWFLAGIGAALAAALAGAGAAIWWVARNEPDNLAAAGALLFTLAAPAGISFWMGARNRGRSAIIALSMAMLASLVPFTTYGSGWLARNRSAKALVSEYASVIGKAGSVYSGFRTMNSLVFYLRRPVVVDNTGEGLLEKLDDPRPWACILPAGKYARNRSELSGYFVAEADGKVLLSNVPDAPARQMRR